MAYFEAGEWPVSYAGTGCSAFTSDNTDSGAQETFEQIAANLLWNWTNRVFGIITETIRPVRVRTPWRPSTWEGLGPEPMYFELGAAFTGNYGWLPAWGAYGWLALRCGIHGTVACSCGPDVNRAIHLPGPVQEIVEIVIDGEVLDPAAYRVDQKHLLIRQDGGTWPVLQDLISPTSGPDALNTWEITFTRGVPVPIGGQIAAGLLACELYKAAVGDATCGLPSRVQSITRQGVSMEVVQTTFEEMKEGRTGLWPIDSWITSVTTPRDYVGTASPETVARSGRTAWGLGYRR